MGWSWDPNSSQEQKEAHSQRHPIRESSDSRSEDAADARRHSEFKHRDSTGSAELSVRIPESERPETNLKKREDAFKNWFGDSTHQYLFLESIDSTTENTSDSCRCGYFYAAVLILLCQIASYGVMIHQADVDLRDPSFVLKLDRDGCDDLLALHDGPSMHPTASPTMEPTLEPSLHPTASPTTEPTMLPTKHNQSSTTKSIPHELDWRDMTCDVDELNDSIFSVVLLCLVCAILLMSDLARDCVGACDVAFPCCTRTHSALKCTAAIMYSLVSMNAGNSAEAIMSCVAVLFLHDVDEKLFPLLAPFRNAKGFNGWFLFYVFVLLIVCVLLLFWHMCFTHWGNVRVWHSTIVFLCAASHNVRLNLVCVLQLLFID